MRPSSSAVPLGRMRMRLRCTPPSTPGAAGVLAIGTVVALVFSAFSLWETSLKQAELSVHVPGVVTYARDTTASADIRPSGGFEVLALPVTIANGGARDAARGAKSRRQKPQDRSERPLRGHLHRGTLLLQPRPKDCPAKDAVLQRW